MGKSISYCYKCSSLLREDDFDRGKAFRDGDRVVCAACAPGLRDSTTQLPAKAAPTRISRRGPSTRLPTVKTPLAFPVPEGLEAKPQGRSKSPMILGVAGGGVALLGILLFFAFSKNPATAPVPPAPEPEKISRPVEPPPKKEPNAVGRAADRELLESARKYVADRPDDLDGQKGRFEKIIWDFERSTSAVEAKKEIEAIRAKITEKVTAAMAKLEEEIKDLLVREAFGDAMKAVDGAAGRLALTEWPLATSRRSREIGDLAGLRSDELCRQAEALVAQGKTSEAQALVARVRGWELPKLLEKIEEAAGGAAAAKGIEKPRSEEGKSYLARWQRAMVRVAARDYTEALGDLQSAAAGLKETEIAAEANADLEDIKRLQMLVRETTEEKIANPPGG